MKLLITENYDDEPAQAHIETIKHQDTFDKQHLMVWLHQHIYNPYFSSTGEAHRCHRRRSSRLLCYLRRRLSTILRPI